MLETIVSYGIYIGIGYLLVVLNNTFAIIRVRASVQTSIFLLLTALYPTIHHLQAGDFVAICYMGSMSLMFLTYKKHDSCGYIFHAFALLGVSSILLPKTIWTIPVFWMAAYSLQSLNTKSFMASLLGWAFPFWMLLSYCIICSDMRLLIDTVNGLCKIEPIHFELLTARTITLAYTVILFIVSSIHCLNRNHDEGIRTRVFLNFFITLGFFLLLLMIIQPETQDSLMPLLIVLTSMMAGHFFTLTDSRVSNIFFILSILAIVPLFFYNLWMLL